MVRAQVLLMSAARACVGAFRGWLDLAVTEICHLPLACDAASSPTPKATSMLTSAMATQTPAANARARPSTPQDATGYKGKITRSWTQLPPEIIRYVARSVCATHDNLSPCFTDISYRTTLS